MIRMRRVATPKNAIRRSPAELRGFLVATPSGKSYRLKTGSCGFQAAYNAISGKLQWQMNNNASQPSKGAKRQNLALYIPQ
jgi:hypothetical protein